MPLGIQSVSQEGGTKGLSWLQPTPSLLLQIGSILVLHTASVAYAGHKT